MSIRDAIHYSTSAPTPTTAFVRLFWYVEVASDLYIWSNSKQRYELFIPDIIVPPIATASQTVKGALFLATLAEVQSGTLNSKAVTPATLAARLLSITGSPPATLETLGALAAAINNDPNFADTLSTALETKANTSGSNLPVPGISSRSKAIATTKHVQDILVDTEATPSNISEALNTRNVLGATNAGGSQRFVSLPALDRYLSIVERTVVGVSGGTSGNLRISDDLILLDGSNGVVTFRVGNPLLFKKKRYSVAVVNFSYPPVLSFDPSYPTVEGDTLVSSIRNGQVFTLVPTSLGKWALAR